MAALFLLLLCAPLARGLSSAGRALNQGSRPPPPQSASSHFLDLLSSQVGMVVKCTDCASAMVIVRSDTNDMVTFRGSDHGDNDNTDNNNNNNDNLQCIFQYNREEKSDSSEFTDEVDSFYQSSNVLIEKAIDVPIDCQNSILRLVFDSTKQNNAFYDAYEKDGADFASALLEGVSGTLAAALRMENQV